MTPPNAIAVSHLDFSGAAIDAANELATRAGADATFVKATNEEAPDLLNRQFDVVFTSVGVLAWLPDLRSWARSVDRLLKPGGVFFIYEGHPMVMTLQYDRADDQLVVTEPYFGNDAPQRNDHGIAYASEDTAPRRTTYEWPHSLDEIMTSLLDVGLAIESFHEHNHMPWKPIPSLVATGNGYALPAGRERVPLMFSLAARKR